jgi:hypothetical protein
MLAVNHETNRFSAQATEVEALVMSDDHAEDLRETTLAVK